MANQMGDASEGRAAGKGKPLNSIKHKQSKPVKAWIKNELNQQQKRFKKILQHMEDITPKREKWFQQFFDTISTRGQNIDCLLYTSPSPRDRTRSRMPSSA